MAATAGDAARILSRRDLSFLLYEWLDAAALTTRERFADHSRETFEAAIDTSAKIAADHFQPINRLLDENEPTFDGEKVTTPAPLKRALAAFAESGLTAAGQDYDLGGMQLPSVIEKACVAYVMGASVAAAGYPMLTVGNANLLVAHGSREQVDRYVRPMMNGRFFGTMCLSEPQAGSSLADITTRAERQADGTWRLFGNKMWISGGEHDLAENIVHLVLARTVVPGEPPLPGVKGISIFIVPRTLVGDDGRLGERNDVVLAGLNHKMGYRGTTNCLLNFGEGRFTPGGRAGAIGELVGAPNQGLAIMFHMMNEARIGVGLGAVMLAYTGYLHALDYARQRPQGRRPGAKDPRAPQVPIITHADVRRMLLAQKAYAEGSLALVLYCARLVDDQHSAPDEATRRRAHLLLELLTPIVKSWPSQWGQESVSLAVQVHGGYGYTRDYPVEQFYRDQRLNPIHEGTHGIQALDLLGRKMNLADGAAAQAFATVIGDTAARAGAASAEWGGHGAALVSLTARVGTTVRRLLGQHDPELGLANASVFLEAFGHLVLGWVWLEQALVAHDALGQRGLETGGAGGAPDEDDESCFYRGKLQAARFFLRWELPKVTPMLELLDSVDPTCHAMRDEWF